MTLAEGPYVVGSRSVATTTVKNSNHVDSVASLSSSAAAAAAAANDGDNVIYYGPKPGYTTPGGVWYTYNKRSFSSHNNGDIFVQKFTFYCCTLGCSCVRWAVYCNCCSSITDGHSMDPPWVRNNRRDNDDDNDNDDGVGYAYKDPIINNTFFTEDGTQIPSERCTKQVTSKEILRALQKKYSPSTSITAANAPPNMERY